MNPGRSVCYFAAVLLIILPAVSAWGPISHYYFACNAVQNIQQLNPNFQNLYIGADEPDAMYFLAGIGGTECEPIANQLHSPIYAGYMISQALWNSTYSGDQELLSFAVGYATHNVADQVGFATTGGYLGNDSQIIDWSLEWPFMLAIDAYIDDNLFESCSGIRHTFPTTPLSAKGVQFMADVNNLYHAVDPTFPLFNATQIAACSNPWAPEVNRKNQYSVAQLPSTTAQQLVFFDHFGAVNEEQAVDNMMASISCINAAHTYYFDLMFQPQADPLGVFQKTVAYIDQLFAAGNCTAGSSTNQTVAKKQPKLAVE